MRSVFLEGKNITLSPLSGDENLEHYANWLNDQETTLFMGSGIFPQTAADLINYIDQYNKSREGMLLGIFLNETSKHVGNITLHLIDWKNRYAEIGIFIGDKDEYGKGYATEAIQLIVEHAFYRLNLHKVCTGLVKGNEASKRVFEKVGFKVEGTLREHFYVNQEYHDCYKLGLLRREYKVEK